MSKPWEGRSVWCSGGSDGDKPKGWIEVREENETHLRVLIRNSDTKSVVLTREEAKTLAAHMMNLAGRTRA